MNSVSRRRGLLLGGVLLCATAIATSLPAQSLDQPQTRMRPIGAPSAVDQYRPKVQSVAGRLQETSYQSPVRQTVMLQQGTFSPPPLPMNPSAPSTASVNPAVPEPSQTMVTSDAQPIPQPQLGNQFATVDNCVLVSPPSAYSAAFQYDGCGNMVVPQSYAEPLPAAQPLTYSPAEVEVPVAVPVAPPTNAQLGAPMRSVITFGQERNPVQVGQGIVGQPVAYVPGQPLRNWLRYFFP